VIVVKRFLTGKRLLESIFLLSLLLIANSVVINKFTLQKTFFPSKPYLRLHHQQILMLAHSLPQPINAQLLLGL
jgi:hypothetical protein